MTIKPRVKEGRNGIVSFILNLEDLINPSSYNPFKKSKSSKVRPAAVPDSR